MLSLSAAGVGINKVFRNLSLQGLEIKSGRKYWEHARLEKKKKEQPSKRQSNFLHGKISSLWALFSGSPYACILQHFLKRRPFLLRCGRVFKNYFFPVKNLNIFQTPLQRKKVPPFPLWGSERRWIDSKFFPRIAREDAAERKRKKDVFD